MFLSHANNNHCEQSVYAATLTFKKYFLDDM